jgi:hypothetical protein
MQMVGTMGLKPGAVAAKYSQAHLLRKK